MAYDATKLSWLSHGPIRVASYANGADNILGANYFDAAADVLKVGDVILTNNGTNPNIVGVTANSGTAVTVAAQA